MINSEEKITTTYNKYHKNIFCSKKNTTKTWTVKYTRIDTRIYKDNNTKQV